MWSIQRYEGWWSWGTKSFTNVAVCWGMAHNAGKIRYPSLMLCYETSLGPAYGTSTSCCLLGLQQELASSEISWTNVFKHHQKGSIKYSLGIWDIICRFNEHNLHKKLVNSMVVCCFLPYFDIKNYRCILLDCCNSNGMVVSSWRLRLTLVSMFCFIYTPEN